MGVGGEGVFLEYGSDMGEQATTYILVSNAILTYR